MVLVSSLHTELQSQREATVIHQIAPGMAGFDAMRRFSLFLCLVNRNQIVMPLFHRRIRKADGTKPTPQH